MIRFITQRLLSVHHQYRNAIEQQRAHRLLLITVVIFIAGVAWLPLQVLPRLLAQEAVDPTLLSGLVGAFAICTAVYGLIQRGWLRPAIWLIVIGTSFIGLIGITGWPDGGVDISGTFMMLVMIPLVVAGVLLRRRGVLLVTLVLVSFVIVGAIAQTQHTTAETQIPSQLVNFDATVAITTLFIIMLFLLAFNRNLEQIAIQSLELIRQHQQINDMSQELSQLEDEAEIINRAARLTRVYYAHLMTSIYVLDANGDLSFMGGYRQAEALESRKRRLNTDPSIIGEAARSRQITMTSLNDATPGRNSHLAVSASYATALPMLNGSHLMGVLDIQSAAPVAQSDLDMLGLFAGQIAIALKQAQTVTRLRRSLQDQEQTARQLRDRLQEYTRQGRDQVGDIWSTYVRGRGTTAFGFDITGDSEPVQANDLPLALAQTLASGTLRVEQNSDEQIINVPIKFRDYHLGAMSFAVPAGQALSERQLAVAKVIAERLAIALENTRLFEQSQDQALRERKASEVTAQLIGATDVREVLNRAAEQFKEALGAINTHIYIQPDMLVEPLAHLNGEEAR
jgi:GAF domain-containing protein